MHACSDLQDEPVSVWAHILRGKVTADHSDYAGNQDAEATNNTYPTETSEGTWKASDQREASVYD